MKLSKFFMIILFLLINLFLFNGCNTNLNSNRNKNIIDSTIITTVTGKTIKVDRIDNGLIFEGYENKIILLEVYGSSCPHCIAAISGYNRLQSKYTNDLKVITIESYGELNRDGLLQYTLDHNMMYTTVAKEDAGKIFNFIENLTGYTPETAGVPILIVLSRDGNLIEYFPPQDFPEDEVDKLIQGLL